MNDDRYIVPPYQRPYSWTQEQCSQLYEDIRLAPFISKQCIILDKPRGICNHTWSSHLIRAMIDAF